jgi:RNA recognition motif-containing protein
MLRNVPQRYTEKGLMMEFNRSGYVGKYDFFFLPVNERAGRNRGFAFVNFSDAEVAQRFYDQYHGNFLRNFMEEGKAPLLILPADVQGFEANALRITRDSSKSHGTPVILRALPQVGSLDPEELAHQAKIVEGGVSQQMAFQANAVPLQAPSSSELPPWPLMFAGAGQKQPPRRQMQMRPTMQRFCCNCGGQLRGGFHFCPYCGCQKDMLS